MLNVNLFVSHLFQPLATCFHIQHWTIKHLSECIFIYVIVFPLKNTSTEQIKLVVRVTTLTKVCLIVAKLINTYDTSKIVIVLIVV